MTIFIDLVLDNNDIVRIDAPNNIEDELHDAITNAIKRRDWWSPSQFDGCHANINGMMMNRVAMWRVVGTL